MVLGFFLGQYKDRSASKSAFYAQCIVVFYNPFFSLLYRQKDKFHYQISSAEPAFKRKALDLIHNGILYMGSNTQAAAFNVLNRYKDDFSDDISGEDNFNESFTVLFNTALKEYINICKKQGWPKPNLEFFSYYDC